MRRVILAIVATAAALVFVLSFKTHGTSPVTTPPAAVSGQGSSAAVSGQGSSAAVSGQGSTGSTVPSSPSPRTGSASTSTGSASTAAKTVTGDAADTMYGPVQVQITVKNDKVTAAQAVEYPQDTPRDQQINAYAIPVLNQEAVAAGSARIDGVSGATYTSEGYATSLQSALDKAGL